MHYSKNQRIILLILSILAVVSVVVRCLVNPAWGKEVVKTENPINDTIFAEVKDSVKKDTVRKYPRKECFRFELNGVTKEELMRFPGIAEGRAGAIIGYRERLGGFYSVEQLREIKCMPDSLVDKMKQWVWVSEDSIKRLNVQTMKVWDMKCHPYIGFERGKRIDSVRWVITKKKCDFTVDSCRFVFTQEEWNKVKRYLK